MQDIFLFMQHHEWLLQALVVVALLIIIVEKIRQKRGAQQLTPRAVTLLMNHQNALIVDLRPTATFAEGHIVGAHSVPVSELTNKTKKLDKFKSQPLVLVCATGVESTRAAPLLKKEGFNVVILAGGIRGWKEADMPLVRK